MDLTSATPELTAQMEAVVQQMGQLERAAVLWMVVSALLLLLLLVVLVQVVRIRRRNRKVERWLEGEMRSLHEKQDSLYLTLLQPRRQARPEPPRQDVPPAPPATNPPAQRVAPQPPSPAPQAMAASRPLDIAPLLNEMLAGNQPYNFIESIRAVEPELNLQRLTPRTGDAFAPDVTLTLGGDGLFASVTGETAELYPNYGRFSATLDPTPLFDGAKHGARIHSVLAPARLARQADGGWLLTQKGRVQMRQGK